MKDKIQSDEQTGAKKTALKTAKHKNCYKHGLLKNIIKMFKVLMINH